MAARRPENADEALVAKALSEAFGGPVPAAAFHAGREAILAAAAQAAEDAGADQDLVAETLTAAFAQPLDPEVVAAGAAAVRTAATVPDNVVPLRRRMVQRAGRHAVAAAVAVSTLAGSSGVAAASSAALPGQMLYPVKRAVEQVMLTAAVTPEAEARMQAKLAARRLAEAERLLADGAAPDVVAPLLGEYERHVAVVMDLAVPEASDDVAVLERMAVVLREQTGDVAVAGNLDESQATTTTPSPAATEPASTTTEAPVTEAPATTQPTEPAPTETAVTPTRTEGTTTTTQPTAAPTGEEPTTTSPSPSPSSSPSPSPSPSPSREAETDGSDGRVPPGQAKPKPNKTDTTKSPTPSPSPTTDRAPLSDSEPLYDSGPVADFEQATLMGGG